MVISSWLPVTVSFACVDYVYKTKADENLLSLLLQVAITRKNTKITRLYVIHTRKKTK